MKKKKSAPKTKNTAAKSKTNKIHIRRNKPKTSGAIKAASITASTVDTLKRRYAKSKAELRRQTEEQTQTPENYAVDTVEEKAESAAYTAADAVKRTGRYLKNDVRRQCADKNIPNNDVDKSSSHTSTKQKTTLPETNHTSQKASSEAKQPPQESMKITARQKAAVKSKEQNSEHKPDIKTKDNVLSRSADEPPRIKTKDSVLSCSAEESPKIKTKDNILSERQHANAEQPKIKTAQQQAAKANAAKTAAAPASHTTAATVSEPVENISTTAAAPEMQIKTKDNYLQSKANQHSRTYSIKSGERYKSQPKTLQTVQAKQSQQLQLPADKAQAAKKYVQNKLKTKAEIKMHNGENQPVSEIPAQAEQHIPPKNTQEQIKTKHMDIKTRDSYIRSHVQGISEIETKPVGTAEGTRLVQNKKPIKCKSSVTKTAASKSKPVKRTRTVKTSRKPIKKSTKTQKQITKQAAKCAKELAQRTAQTAKQAAKAAARVAVQVAQAVVAAAKAIVSAIASGGAAAVVAVVLVVVIMIAAMAAGPFGIFISEEVADAGTIPLSQIIAEYNTELTQETENIELTVSHTDVEVADNRTDNNIVIAVFAAMIAGTEDSTAEDVVVFDDAKAERLKDVFRTANTVSHTVEETTENGAASTRLTITVTGKTKDELMNEYSLTARQREAVEILLENGNILTSSSHSLVITDAEVQSIINGLPDSLPQKRKDVIKNAGSLVGKVNYFWGGKSSAIGWDSAWGTMQRVTAAGSPSSGTIRAYGLDCSGFVSWAFNNSGMYVGDGTSGQRGRSVQVSASEVQAGDLCFLPSYSHVGIVAGKDASGNILVFHCSSGANNVVVSTASSVGFTVFRRPNCY